jgi:hypothetical protein
MLNTSHRTTQRRRRPHPQLPTCLEAEKIQTRNNIAQSGDRARITKSPARVTEGGAAAPIDPILPASGPRRSRRQWRVTESQWRAKIAVLRAVKQLGFLPAVCGRSVTSTRQGDTRDPPRSSFFPTSIEYPATESRLFFCLAYTVIFPEKLNLRRTFRLG